LQNQAGIYNLMQLSCLDQRQPWKIILKVGALTAIVTLVQV